MASKRRVDEDIEGFKSFFVTDDFDGGTIVNVKASVRITPKEKKCRYSDELEKVEDAFSRSVDRLIRNDGRLYDRRIFSCKTAKNHAKFGHPTMFKYDLWFVVSIGGGIDSYSGIIKEIVHGCNERLSSLISNGGFDIFVKTPNAKR